MLDDFSALDLFSLEELQRDKAVLRRKKRRFGREKTVAAMGDDLGMKGRWSTLLPAISRKLHVKHRFAGWHAPRNEDAGRPLS